MGKRLKIATCVAVAAISLGGGYDGWTYTQFSTEPTATVYSARHSNHTIAVVVFGGAGQRAEIQTRQLRNVWHAFGLDVIVVEPALERYDEKKMVDCALHIVRLYDKFIVAVISSGAPLGTDLLDRVAQGVGMPVPLGILAYDPLMDGSDMLPPGAWITNLWYPGSLSNLLLSKPFWWLFSSTPVIREVDANRADIDEADQAARNFPLSTYRDEVHSAQVRRPLMAGSYHIPLVVLRSLDDKVVSQGSTNKWLAAFQGYGTVLWVVSSHGGFQYSPRAWGRATERGVEKILSNE